MHTQKEAHIHKWEIRSFYVLTVSFLFNSFICCDFVRATPKSSSCLSIFCPFAFVDGLRTAFSLRVIDQHNTQTLSSCRSFYGRLSFFSVFSLFFRFFSLSLVSLCHFYKHLYSEKTLFNLSNCKIVIWRSLSPNWFIYLSSYMHQKYPISHQINTTFCRLRWMIILSAINFDSFVHRLCVTNWIWWAITNWKIKESRNLLRILIEIKSNHRSVQCVAWNLLCWTRGN